MKIEKDKKGRTWIITTTDSEGFHRQINVTREEMIVMFNEIKKILNDGMEEAEGV